ncbi:MAG: glycosyltransferase [Bacteroidaceae bacterium]
MKEIICITTYPPRECGIATFSDDLIKSIHNKFSASYSIKVGALASTSEQHTYDDIVKYVLNTSDAAAFASLADKINHDTAIELICVQHEFGLFHEQEEAFLQFVEALAKPLVFVLHTVLPTPSLHLQNYMRRMTDTASALVVMTQTSSDLLQKEYHIDKQKIEIIPHGTHLVPQMDKRKLKEKYELSGRKVLSTFGLLSPGKCIETTLDALPAILQENPTVLFLIIGKTHPSILETEKESYREMLQAKVEQLELTDHVRFVNFYLDLPVLLEYLQLTDIYLFTSCDPNQAVSGTFVYALSCGCPIIATPIPHTLELLQDQTGLIFDFKNSTQLAELTNKLLSDKSKQAQMKIISLQKMAATVWENAAIAYATLFQKVSKSNDALQYTTPPTNMNHLKRMSQHFAMIQFSKGNRPDLSTGYTLDDNARALMALCQLYTETADSSCEKYIKRYLNFIEYCAQPDGSFLNYVDKSLLFTTQNQEVGLEDSNARALCALGYFISYQDSFPDSWGTEAMRVFEATLPRLLHIQSPRSIAFTIKGLAFYNQRYPKPEILSMIQTLSDRLIGYYQTSVDGAWRWFEAYLTYDNSVLPESLLYAWKATGNAMYKEIAKESFDFLLDKTFTGHQIKVISNQGWLQKKEKSCNYGEQPIDVAGTVIALKTFFDVFKEPQYKTKQQDAFSWFLGNNHLQQIVYNPATGGCYDGLEEKNINLNQGAESSVCYLMAKQALLSP